MKTGIASVHAAIVEMKTSYLTRVQTLISGIKTSSSNTQTLELSSFAVVFWHNEEGSFKPRINLLPWHKDFRVPLDAEKHSLFDGSRPDIYRISRQVFQVCKDKMYTIMYLDNPSIGRYLLMYVQLYWLLIIVGEKTSKICIYCTRIVISCTIIQTLDE